MEYQCAMLEERSIIIEGSLVLMTFNFSRKNVQKRTCGHKWVNTVT